MSEKHYYDLTEAMEIIERLKAERDAAIESECDKILAMTDEQVSALAAIRGSSGDIDALEGKLSCTRALLTVAKHDIAKLTAERDDLFNRATASEFECNALKATVAHARRVALEEVAAHYDKLTGYEVFGPTIAEEIRSMK